MRDIQDRSKNPGYSSYTQQLFMSQLSDQEFSVFQEKAYKFPGFYIQRRSIRQYEYPNAALLLGDVAEVSPDDIKEDDYYQPGDYIGKVGVERFYEKELRGTKGVQVLLRDSRGRIQGNYHNGEFDTKPVPGKALTLGIDIELQRLGERLLEGKLGSHRGHRAPHRRGIVSGVLPLLRPPDDDRTPTRQEPSAVGERPPQAPAQPCHHGTVSAGSTFKTSQALTFLTEAIIDSTTKYPCYRGFVTSGMKVGCHGHRSPLNLIPAIGTSCNGFFCWGLYHMLTNKKYGTLQNAMDTWRDYMVSMGFGYKLGIDLPGEKRGMIPNATFYDKAFKHNWNALGVISISIGQGEVTLTPLQIANLGATIANRGYYITPHVVKEIEGQPIDTLYTKKKYTMANRNGLRPGGKGHAKGGHRRYLPQCQPPRLSGLRQDGHGPEPTWPRPLGVHGIRPDERAQDSRQRVCGEWWLRCHFRRTYRFADDGTVYQGRAIGEFQAPGSPDSESASQVWNKGQIDNPVCSGRSIGGPSPSMWHSSSSDG